VRDAEAPVVAQVVDQTVGEPMASVPRRAGQDDNPYRAPQTESYPLPRHLDPHVAAWRSGRLLVLQKGADLPDRCVKSNRPANGRRLKRRMAWHHGAIYLLILVSLLVYIIVALIMQQKATVYIGLSEEWFAKRRRATLIGWLSVLAGIALVVLGVKQLNATATGGGLRVLQPEMGGWLMAAGFLVFFVGAIYGLLASRMVAPARIDKHFVWIKGACPAYLSELPDWPYPV
jgi:hypothetical protein